MTDTAPFTTLAEANDWLARGKAEVGGRAFLATAEYARWYPAFRALYVADKPNRDARKAAAKARNAEMRARCGANLLRFV